MKKNHILIAVAVALAAGFCLTDHASAQVFRIDACNYLTDCIKLVPDSGPPGPLSPECWGLPLLEDGWTESEMCLGPVGNFFEAETYLFKSTADPVVIFVDKIKLVPDMSGTIVPFQIVEDIFILPCNPATAANPSGENFSPASPPPILFLDDVTFPTINVDPLEGPVEFLCAVFVPMQDITAFFGPNFPVHLDWFACADLDSLGLFYGQPPSIDLDGNGCPDSCFEIMAGGSPLIQRQGIDEKGAGMVNFFLNRAALGLFRINVFEPQPSSLIPALLPGMSSGESHNTRPWCFTIDV